MPIPAAVDKLAALLMQHHIFYDTRITDVHDDIPKWWAPTGVCLRVHVMHCLFKWRKSMSADPDLILHRAEFMDSSERLG